MAIPPTLRDAKPCFMCKHFKKEMEHGGCEKHQYGLATFEELFATCDDFQRDT